MSGNVNSLLPQKGIPVYHLISMALLKLRQSETSDTDPLQHRPSISTEGTFLREPAITMLPPLEIFTRCEPNHAVTIPSLLREFII
jgi:hypothetical protein